MKKVISAFFIAILGGASALTINYFINYIPNSTAEIPPQTSQLNYKAPSRFVNLPGSTENSIDFTIAAEATFSQSSKN